MRVAIPAVVLSIVGMGAASCHDRRERNIIVNVDRGPFLEEHFAYRPDANDRIISAARRFAESNSMDFLLARGTLPQGDFNVHAATRDLNLVVMHAGAIDREGTAVIFAITRAAPEAADLRKAREFACVVGGKCDRHTDTRTLSNGS